MSFCHFRIDRGCETSLRERTEIILDFGDKSSSEKHEEADSQDAGDAFSRWTELLGPIVISGRNELRDAASGEREKTPSSPSLPGDTPIVRLIRMCGVRQIP